MCPLLPVSYWALIPPLQVAHAGPGGVWVWDVWCHMATGQPGQELRERPLQGQGWCQGWVGTWRSVTHKDILFLERTFRNAGSACPPGRGWEELNVGLELGVWPGRIISCLSAGFSTTQLFHFLVSGFSP